MKSKTYYTITAAALCLTLISLFNACSSKTTSPGKDRAPAGGTDYQYSRISPFGGFVSSVAYRPGVAGEIWASGDDTSGLFRSQNGGNNWSTIRSAPLDQSTYALTFDPNNSQIIYAPNHFGRGLLKSINGGSTWQVHTTGLPADNNANERIYDMALDPNATQNVYMALEGGLYKSTNSGQSFSQISNAAFTANSDTSFHSVKIQKVDGTHTQIFLGSAQGRVYKSTNNGTTWTELTAGAYVRDPSPPTITYYPVTDIAITKSALYVAFAEGTIIKTTTYALNSFSYVNNSTSGAIIEGNNDMWTKIAAVSGANTNSDQLYIGSVYKVGSTKWGFFYSGDGGATLQKRMTGLDNSSAFSIAVNPTNSSEVIMGTINNGIFRSPNKGVNWVAISQGIQATSSLAFAEDPTDADHLLFSSTAGLDGTSKLYESTTKGTSWSIVNFFSDKSVRSLLYPSSNANVIVAGTQFRGIYKTTTGVNGTWAQVSTANTIISSMQKDNVNSNILYASAFEPQNNADRGTYVSTNAGTSWVRRLAFPVADVATHPTVSGVAVAVTGNVVATADSFTTSAFIAPTVPAGEIFFSVAFIPGTSTLLVGSSAGKIYKTTNFNASGAGVTWQTITLPITDVVVKQIIVVDAQTWYVSAFQADIHVKATSTPGILRTTDGGATWEFLNSGLSPSRLVVQVYPSLHQANQFFLGMWGAGFLSFLF